MEYLDVYDENRNYLGKYERNYVHENALWHNTVHCWLFDKYGNVYFQIRKDENKFYTTASGHVIAGEEIKEAFGREIKEELGLDIDYNNAIPVDIYVFKMDKVKKDGTVFRDRAFSNVYVYEFNENINNFKFDLNEIKGLVKVNANDTLKLLENEKGIISSNIIKYENGENISNIQEVSFEDFLVNKNEVAIEKYGDILRKIIEITRK